MTIIAPSRALIDRTAYAHNLAQVRRLLPRDCLLAPVVKANAYGHGAVPLARTAVAEGAALLGVATVPEGIELREAGITAPILVLVQPDEAAIESAVRHNLELTVSSLSFAQAVSGISKRLDSTTPVHCKIDTGMGRQGIASEQAVDSVLQMKQLAGLQFAGVATHFPVADVPEDPQTNDQVCRFAEIVAVLRDTVGDIGHVHAASSGAIVYYPGSAFTMVRPGLMTYGVWGGERLPSYVKLRPVLRWETTVVLVKDLPVGATIGYNRTYTVPSRQRVALLPVGYADGYKFRLANHAEVLIRGVRRPVRGRISMDQIVVDISRPPEVRPGDAAVLIGADGDDAITVEELARLAETIPYDILTGIGNRVERVYVR